MAGALNRTHVRLRAPAIPIRLKHDDGQLNHTFLKRLPASESDIKGAPRSDQHVAAVLAQLAVTKDGQVTPDGGGRGQLIYVCQQLVVIVLQVSSNVDEGSYPVYSGAPTQCIGVHTTETTRNDVGTLSWYTNSPVTVSPKSVRTSGTLHGSKRRRSQTGVSPPGCRWRR